MSYQLGSIRKIIAGENSLKELPENVKSLNAKAVEIITDEGVYALGLTKGAEKLLEDAQITVHVIHDVPPPSLRTSRYSISMSSPKNAHAMPSSP